MNLFNELKSRIVFRATHEQSPGRNAQMATIAALQGDVEFATSMDYGGRSGFFQERFFGTIAPDDPRTDALFKRMRARIDAERWNLGLPPLARPKG